MKSTLNNTCISALLCGAVLVALPAFAAGIGATAGGGIGAGAMTGAAGTSLGTGMNTTGSATTPAGSLNNNVSANANGQLAIPYPTARPPLPTTSARAQALAA